ncbi:hypothetical protein [Microbacterium sp. Marseille-Q6965]|nr:hypothetical protein [Microbacterium sp. Marseille-Q6965]
MSENDVTSGKPSQAEGEDPERTSTGDAPETDGHPSQAEGEDDEDA